VADHDDETDGNAGERRRRRHGRRRSRSSSSQRSERASEQAATTSRGGRRLGALAVVVVAAALTALNAVWLWDTQQAEVYRDTLAGLRSGELRPDEAAAVLADGSSPPLNLFSTGAADLANAAFYIASATASSPDPAIREQAADAVAQARALVEANLAEEPAQPFMWARLIYLMQLQAASPERIREALRLSMYVGPEVEPLLMWRIRLMSNMLAYGDPTIPDQISHHVRLLVEADNTRQFLLCENVDLLPVIRRVLKDDAFFYSEVFDENARARVRQRCGVELPGPPAAPEAPAQLAPGPAPGATPPAGVPDEKPPAAQGGETKAEPASSIDGFASRADQAMAALLAQGRSSRSRSGTADDLAVDRGGPV